MQELVKRQQLQQPRLQIWKDRNHHLLRARVNAAMARGEIEMVSHYGVTEWGSGTLVVRVLRPSRMPLYKRVAAVLFIAALATIGVMIYQARDLIMSAIGGCLAIVVLGYLATRVGHTLRCSGLHCSGCRG